MTTKHDDAAPAKMLSRRRVVQTLAAAPIVLHGARVLAAPPAPPAPAARFEVKRSTLIGGRRIAYRVVSEDIDLFKDDARIGSIFSFTYLREDILAAQDRPVVFMFNGGPGSSSVWLHLGVMGPRTVKLDRDVNPSVVPPFALVDNHACLLDIADLVFVDPVGTGFSRIRDAGKPTDFYGVDEDANSVAQFMDAWLSRHDRWSSPKFVVGESYGTVRAAVMQRALVGGPGDGGALRAITLDGIVLIGSLLGSVTVRDRDRDAETLLPNYAATAWYHDKIDRAGRALASFVDEAIRFAQGPYAEMLRQGSRMAVADRQGIAARLSSYIGLPERDIVRADMRITSDVFATILLEQEGLDVGIYDSRYTLPHRPADVKLDPVADDPAMAQYTPGFTAAWHDYLARDLGVRIDRPYGSIVWSGLSDHWRYDRDGIPAEQGCATDLVLAMRRNPRLRLLVASGYYDLATPFLATEEALAQAEAPLDRIRFQRYESGHMAYFGGTGDAFLADVRALIRSP